MKTNTSRLDVDELLHLAIHASQQNRHEDTMNYLKQALEIAPENAKVHYLLGAEHAEIGLYDRAVTDMEKAVKFDPSLVTAHFQLGLLHVTAGRVDQAVKAWKPLDALGQENPLYLFKTGLEQLVRDQFDSCIDSLSRGIKLNTMNEALNKDMQRIIDDVKARQQQAPAASTKSDKPKSTPASHVLLSAYRNNKEEKND